MLNTRLAKERDDVRQIKALAIFRVLLAKDFWELAWKDPEDAKEMAAESAEYIEGVELIAKSLGVAINRAEIIVPSGRFDFDRPITSLTESCILSDTIGKQLEEIHGEAAKKLFILVEIMFLIRIFSGILGRPVAEGVPAEREPLIRDERTNGCFAMQELGKWLLDDYELAVRVIGSDKAADYKRLIALLQSRPSVRNYALASRISFRLLMSIFPDFLPIQARISRYRSLATQLSECTHGSQGWRDYEEICVRILRFLLVPPFTQVLTQARSANGTERRDAVVPISVHTGFWGSIIREFGSKHLICEFKNYKSLNSKEALNQLRIYLSKPTIGRFGILFTREPVGKAVIQAQRDAYEQSKILILLIDDATVIQLLRARAFLGSVDSVLNAMKVEFEINY